MPICNQKGNTKMYYLCMVFGGELIRGHICNAIQNQYLNEGERRRGILV